MRKHWLLFSQTITVVLAVLFVIHTLKPELLPNAVSSGVVTLHESVLPSGDSSMPGTGLSAAALKAMPSVVNVFTRTEIKAQANPFTDDPRFKFFFGEQDDTELQSSSSLGSGVIASADGYILTNHRVVEAADQIEVALSDGRKAAAHVIGSDPETDLAVIKIELAGKFPAITFGHSEQAHIGDFVLAIGNPFGVGETVTMGIVSALKRDHLGLSTFENFIQTDAAINPGNSGGALVDTNGNLIGINTLIFSRSGGYQGIGFAIPVSLAKKVMEQIIETGGVTRGWFGVEVADVSPELAESLGLKGTNGAIVGAIERGSPAEKSGMRLGDVIVAVNERPVSNSTATLNA